MQTERCKMDNYKQDFSLLLEREDKQAAVEYAIDLLNQEKLDVIDLYSHILAPALNSMQCFNKEQHICVWKEHVRTAIVRTIVECSYPYVIKERNRLNMGKKGKVVVLCPPEEYHDLGAKMAADFYTICGFDVTFVGSNTPYVDFYNAIGVVKPDIIAISVSNYYNLVVTKKIIEALKEKMQNSAQIVVGGYAFSKSKDKVQMVGADFYAESFEDIKRIAERKVER